jgi:hypothetical protein
LKRSQRISLRLVPIVAAAFLAACETPQRKTCVDQRGRIVADANCAAGTGASWDSPRSGGGYYHWYWYRGSAPIMGGRAPGGGTFSAPEFAATPRGGFGATAADHAGGAS